MKKVDRSKIPKPLKLNKFSTPIIQNLPGITTKDFLIAENHKLPLIYLGLFFDAGSRYDPKGKAGVSHIMTQLLTEGAAGTTALDFHDRVERLGASIDVYSSHDGVHFLLSCLSEKLDKTLDLLSMMLMQPNFEKSEFDRNKIELQHSLQEMKDYPEYVASTMLDRFCFEESNTYSNAIIGHPNTIPNIELDDILPPYMMLRNNSHTSGFVCGDISPEEITKKLTKVFRNEIGKGKTSSFSSLSSPTPAKIVIIDKKDAPQVVIRFGLLTPEINEREAFPISIFNFIFGGQFTSRLNTSLRERLGYTYNIGSAFQLRKGIAQFYIKASVSIENLAASLKAILFELNRAGEGFTDEEIIVAKKAKILRFPMLFETNSELSSYLETMLRLNLSKDYLEQYFDNISAVSADSINIVYKQKMDLSKLQIVLVGDKTQIYSQMAGINNYPIIEADSEGAIII